MYDVDNDNNFLDPIFQLFLVELPVGAPLPEIPFQALSDAIALRG
jgi:hypothetical protein